MAQQKNPNIKVTDHRETQTTHIQGHSRKIPTSQLHHDKREKLFITDYHIRKHKTSQQNI
jgi:hypothetical protein